MRIHFICKRNYTNKDLLKDQFGRLYHLPVELARLGAQVSVDAVDYKNTIGIEIANERVLFHSTPAVPPLKLSSLPFSLYRNASDMHPDIIIASGDSHIGFLAMLIARRLGVRFVFDVYDYYPVFKSNQIPGFKTMFRIAVKMADLVLCASEPLMHKLLPLNTYQLLVENGVDSELFSPSDMLVARKKLGLELEHQFIGYFGSISQDRGPLLIEACRILRDELPLLHLLLAGHVTKVDLNEHWIKYIGERPHTELPRLINACNLVAIPYASSIFNKMSGACKIAEYLACGKPVVATRVSDHEQIFNDAPASLCNPTPHSLAEAIRIQLEHPEIVVFPMRLGWEYIGRKLSGTLQSIM